MMKASEEAAIAACEDLKRMIHAAENSNQHGEDCVVRAADAERLHRAIRKCAEAIPNAEAALLAIAGEPHIHEGPDLLCAVCLLGFSDPVHSKLSKSKAGVRVTCGTCGLVKKPVGRDASWASANAYCDHECSGYWVDPPCGSLWPGESEYDFGYNVGDAGTEHRP